MQEHKLTLFPSPPHTEIPSTRLENLTAVLTFLDMYMLPCLPEVQKQLMSRSIYKPIATGVLNHLLIPSLPSSFILLLSFLDLVQDAVDFEGKHLRMFGDVAAERTINTWADGVGGYYERKRRMDVLEKARTIITHAEDDDATFSVEVESEPVAQSVRERPAGNDAVDDQARGFDGSGKEGADASVDEAGWGFDEDADKPESPHERTEALVSTDRDKNPGVDEGPAAAWGWNDEDSSAAPDDVDDGSAWDDPWNDAPAEESVPTVPAIPPKLPLNGTNPPLSVNTATNPIPPPTPAKPKETYLVSTYVNKLLKTVEDVLEEGKEFASSRIVASNPSSSSSPGSLILQSAISILDLFRALYPVKFDSILVAPERAMRFSNDCLYLSGQVARFLKQTQNLPDVSQKLMECKESLQVLGDSWFDDAMVRVCHGIHLSQLLTRPFSGVPTTENR
jgi:centromere/kinetochore protein ZW10